MKDTPGTLDGSGWGCWGTALYTFPGLQQRKNLKLPVTRSPLHLSDSHNHCDSRGAYRCRSFISHCKAQHQRVMHLPVRFDPVMTCICGLVLNSGWLRWPLVTSPGHSLGHHDWRGSLYAHWHFPGLLAPLMGPGRAPQSSAWSQSSLSSDRCSQPSQNSHDVLGSSTACAGCSNIVEMQWLD